MSAVHSKFRPWRVAGAVAGGLLVGLLLVKVLLPRTADELSEREGPVVAPPRASALPLRPDAGQLDLAGPRVSQEYVKQRFSAYPHGGKWVAIGERLDAWKVPMSLVAFETDDDEVKVLSHYAAQFEREGLVWQGVKESFKTVPWPAISATDPDAQMQLSVLAMPHEDRHGTTVILAAADMETFYERLHGESGEHEDALPQYPGSEPFVMRGVEPGRQSVLLSFSTPDAPEKVESFYRAAMPSNGFVEVTPRGDELPNVKRVARHLEFTADQKSWRVFISRSKGETAVAVQGTEVPR